jgi:hypothetical protein
MATQLCQKCKQAHPGRVCDYDEKGECAETIDTDKAVSPSDAPPEEPVGTSRKLTPSQERPLPPVRFAAEQRQ